MRQRIFMILAITGCILLNQAGFGLAHSAREEGNDEWEPVSAGPVTTWTAPLCGKGIFPGQRI